MVGHTTSSRAYSNIKDGQGIQLVLKKYILFHMADVCWVLYSWLFFVSRGHSVFTVSAWSITNQTTCSNHLLLDGHGNGTQPLGFGKELSSISKYMIGALYDSDLSFTSAKVTNN